MQTNGNLEDALFKLDLIRQAVVGIAHSGAQGDIRNADDETLAVERLIQDVRADLERAVSGPERPAVRLWVRVPR
jgi:hypothetical protein